VLHHRFGSREYAPARRPRSRSRAVLWALLAMSALSCNHTLYRAKFTPPAGAAAAPLDAEAAFLKCHMNDGSLYVLEAWSLDRPQGLVRGRGIHYAMSRVPLERGAFEVPLDGVVLFETNAPESVTDGSVAVLAVMTGASLVVTALCATNPKACFGSCPTFYAFDGERESLQAEGFSASVARALESTDVDAMWTARPREARFEVRMTNDALETHVVDSVRVLAAPRPAGGRVLRAGDVYYPAFALAPPATCAAQGRDCLAEVAATDGHEYKSEADPHDLATRETLDLTFDARALAGASVEGTPDVLAAGRFPRAADSNRAAVGVRYGLLVVARNSLLNTFLFYQGLAYMGRSAGEIIARLDRGAGGVGRLLDVQGLLGGIRVQAADADGQWSDAGAFDEVGPLALEAQVIPLPPGAPAPTRIRLLATRGYWRIEQIALAALGPPIVPRAFEPASVSRMGVPRPDAKERLAPGGDHLLSWPRDEWLLTFDLPAGDQELFLESRGYYYEWIRRDWLGDENPLELARFMLDPRGEMQRLAPQYKALEGRMEPVFWQSRLGAERVR